jgi:hypothetical protein
MNTALKYTAVGVGAGIVGFTGGYLTSVAIFRKQIQRDLVVIEANIRDSIERETKTGRYSTPEEAAAALIPSTPLGIEEGDGEPDEEVSQPESPEDETEPAFVDEYAREDTEIPVNSAEPEGEKFDPHAFVEKFKNRTAEYGGITFPGQVTDEENMDAEQVVQSVPGFNVVRDPFGPYIISIDMFMTEEEPYTKVEMTYFEGDGTLVDSANQIVPNIDGMVGYKNLDRWGVGTTDKDQVYIRNERFEIDIEVTRDEQTYSRAILGVIPEEELERSMTKPRKMRDTDGD